MHVLQHFYARMLHRLDNFACSKMYKYSASVVYSGRDAELNLSCTSQHVFTCHCSLNGPICYSAVEKGRKINVALQPSYAQFGQMKVRVAESRRSLRKDSDYPYTCAVSRLARHTPWAFGQH